MHQLPLSRLPPLAALRAFESAGRHLSFKKAAQELHVTPAAISQQIKSLERHLGFPVFRRLTRAIELTEQGAALLPRIRQGFDCLASAVHDSRRDTSQTLRITAPPSFATHWLMLRLPDFLAAHPQVDLRLVSSADAVDSGAAGGFALAAPGEPASDIAIRYGSGHYPGWHVEHLFTPAYVPVCSPGLPSADKPLAVPGDLRWHRLIHDETIRDDAKQPNWQEWARVAGVTDVDTRRGPRYSNAVLAVQAAIEGQGVALAIRPLVESELAAGRLVIPFDVAVPSPHAYFMLTLEAMAHRPPIAAFRTWLLAKCQGGAPSAASC